MTAIALIAALDRRRAIGRDNRLPWHLPDDLRRFKALTLGHPVLMGRKTALSLGRALPGRRNLVLSRGGTAPYEGMEVVPTLDAALSNCADAPTLWVIGGGEVYALCLPRADALHLTHVDTVIDAADAWFPPVDFSGWEQVARSEHRADARHAFAFSIIDYRRRTTGDNHG